MASGPFKASDFYDKTPSPEVDSTPVAPKDPNKPFSASDFTDEPNPDNSLGRFGSFMDPTNVLKGKTSIGAYHDTQDKDKAAAEKRVGQSLPDSGFHDDFWLRARMMSAPDNQTAAGIFMSKYPEGDVKQSEAGLLVKKTKDDQWQMLQGHDTSDLPYRVFADNVPDLLGYGAGEAAAGKGIGPAMKTSGSALSATHVPVISQVGTGLKVAGQAVQSLAPIAGGSMYRAAQNQWNKLFGDKYKDQNTGEEKPVDAQSVGDRATQGAGEGLFGQAARWLGLGTNSAVQGAGITPRVPGSNPSLEQAKGFAKAIGMDKGPESQPASTGDFWQRMLQDGKNVVFPEDSGNRMMIGQQTDNPIIKMVQSLANQYSPRVMNRLKNQQATLQDYMAKIQDDPNVPDFYKSLGTAVNDYIENSTKLLSDKGIDLQERSDALKELTAGFKERWKPIVESAYKEAEQYGEPALDISGAADVAKGLRKGVVLPGAAKDRPVFKEGANPGADIPAVQGDTSSTDTNTVSGQIEALSRKAQSDNQVGPATKYAMSLLIGDDKNGPIDLKLKRNADGVSAVDQLEEIMRPLYDESRPDANGNVGNVQKNAMKVYKALRASLDTPEFEPGAQPKIGAGGDLPQITNKESVSSPAGNVLPDDSTSPSAQDKFKTLWGNARDLARTGFELQERPFISDVIRKAESGDASSTTIANMVDSLDNRGMYSTLQSLKSLGDTEANNGGSTAGQGLYNKIVDGYLTHMVSRMVVNGEDVLPSLGRFADDKATRDMLFPDGRYDKILQVAKEIKAFKDTGIDRVLQQESNSQGAISQILDREGTSLPNVVKEMSGGNPDLERGLKAGIISHIIQNATKTSTIRGNELPVVSQRAINEQLAVLNKKGLSELLGQDIMDQFSQVGNLANHLGVGGNVGTGMSAGQKTASAMEDIHEGDIKEGALKLGSMALFGRQLGWLMTSDTMNSLLNGKGSDVKPLPGIVGFLLGPTGSLAASPDNAQGASKRPSNKFNEELKRLGISGSK